MPDLLLELRSEEIPARMQRKAAGDLRKLVTDGLVEAGLTYEGCQEYWTPRRLALDIRGLTARSRDVRDEIKGPSTKAPEQALQGFLRKAGLTDISQAHVHSDPKKGDFYVAHIVKPGRAAEEIIAELVPAMIRDFPWPKSMRWGNASSQPGSLRWVRPLQSILCTFGPETSDPVVVDFEIDGVRSGNVTYGHRFHAPGAITVRRFDDYVAKLEAAKVILDAERRKKIIQTDAQNLAFASGLELVEDEGLLEEVSGLVEWPVVLMGEFEEAFLQIPAEVIRLTIRANQKCFVCRPAGAAETLSNRFIPTANIEASDGGREIAYGNGKVVRARLSDALYFWKTDQGDLPDLDTLKPSAEKFGLDLTKPLDQRMARLDRLGVTFHAKLGTQGERVERIVKLAEELAPSVMKAISPLEGEMGGSPEGVVSGGTAQTSRTGAATPPGQASSGHPPIEGEGMAPLVRRAAVLAKADLQTEVVGEFPELQGAMGRKYALLQGEHASVAAALEEHYKPQGPSDRVPTNPVSVSVALADKLDTLVGFWAIDEKPTGSKDPYALRRAALGVIRIVIENGVRVNLQSVWHRAWLAAFSRTYGADIEAVAATVQKLGTRLHPDTVVQIVDALKEEEKSRISENAPMWASALARQESDLLSFFHDRLKVYLRDKGARHDLIDAVLASGGSSGQSSNDLLTIVRRVEALGSFLDSEDGKNLLAGTKRAANILAAEEKKGTAIADKVDTSLFNTDHETALHAAMNQAEREAGEAIEKEDFSGAMRALSALREPVDSFFEHVLVNDENPDVRANRLALLARIRTATGQVADFSRISG